MKVTYQFSTSTLLLYYKVNQISVYEIIADSNFSLHYINNFWVPFTNTLTYKQYCDIMNKSIVNETTAMTTEWYWFDYAALIQFGFVIIAGIMSSFYIILRIKHSSIIRQLSISRLLTWTSINDIVSCLLASGKFVEMLSLMGNVPIMPWMCQLPRFRKFRYMQLLISKANFRCLFINGNEITNNVTNN